VFWHASLLQHGLPQNAYVEMLAPNPSIAVSYISVTDCHNFVDNNTLVIRPDGGATVK
jgi:hypothetical protein